MKKFTQLSGLTMLLILIGSCTITTKIVEKQGVFDRITPIIDYNHLVVRFPEEWDAAKIDAFLASAEFKKNSNNETIIERCKCGDTRLVRLTWDFTDRTLADIQGAKNGLTGGTGQSQGDWPFTFSLPLIKEENQFKLTDFSKLTRFDFNLTPTHKVSGKKGLSISNKQAKIEALKQSLIASGANDSKVNIAVIDTGMDFYKNKDLDPFLYSTEGLDFGCTGQESGWDFVTNSPDVTDDNGHGTYVTRLITSQLDSKEVKYRILPIKAFNANGEGNYWDIVCALSYVLKVQQENNDLDIVNASFGYTFFNSQISDKDLKVYKDSSIVKSLIEELALNNTLVVGSAGNINHNIEERMKENFPASFTSENILGVGGHVKTDLGSMDTDGNYGNISLDLAAPYGDYEYTFLDLHNLKKEFVELQGSSYSAAFTTAKIAEIIKSKQYARVPPSELKEILFKQDVPNPWTKIHEVLKPKISGGFYLEK